MYVVELYTMVLVSSSCSLLLVLMIVKVHSLCLACLQKIRFVIISIVAAIARKSMRLVFIAVERLFTAARLARLLIGRAGTRRFVHEGRNDERG